MNSPLLVCLLGAAITLFAQTDEKKTTAPAPRTASAEPKIPAGAVKSEDGNYRFTDSKGRKWVYRETPFGMSRYEEKPLDPTATPFGKSRSPAVPVAKPAPDAKNTKDPTVVFDEGDTFRFEKPTPFGTSMWRKKRGELDSSEQKIVDEQLKEQNKSGKQ